MSFMSLRWALTLLLTITLTILLQTLTNLLTVLLPSYQHAHAHMNHFHLPVHRRRRHARHPLYTNSRNRRSESPSGEELLPPLYPTSTVSSSTAGNPKQHHPTLHEIYHTTFLLRHLLPVELIPSILNSAGYLLRHTTQRVEKLTVTERGSGFAGFAPGAHYPAGLHYLSSEPIGVEGLSAVHPVREIVWTVVSKDQGWSDSPDQHGGVDGSWTWCEAVTRGRDLGTFPKRGGSDGAAAATPAEQGNVNADVQQDQSQDSADKAATAELAPVGCASRRICTNIHAGKEYKTHVVRWSADAEDPAEREWVRSLKRGEQIDITVWARFPGWANHVAAARIDVYTAAVR